MNTHKILVAGLLALSAGALPITLRAEAVPSQVAAPEVSSQVSGTVHDSTGEPLIGVSVMEKGTTNGTATDIDGHFTLKVGANATLVFTYVGCKAVEAPATEGMDITMLEDSEILDEVVVVGFGTQKKVNLTGSVSVADSKALSERPVVSAAQALQGVVPGLQITSGDGKLETNASINIRGNGTIGSGSSGSPLILIDGMEGDINTLNPQDIENISVLKDAAAASIYGSRAPFGVILITTKRGSEGKPTVNYNNSFRFSNLINRNHTMDSFTFVKYMNDACQNTAGWSPHFTDEQVERVIAYQNGTLDLNGDGIFDPSVTMETNGEYWANPYDPGKAWANVDWFDELYKDSNFSQEHNLSVSGGKDIFNYYFSANFLDQDGMLKWGDEGLKRYTLTGKFNVDITNWVELGYSGRWTRTDYVRPSKLTDGLYDNTGRQGWPILPVYDENGYLYDAPSPANGLANGGSDKTQTDNNYHQINLIFRPMKNWDIHAEFNYHVKSATRHWDTQMLYNHKVNGDPYVASSGNHVHEDYYKENFYNLNLYSNYDWTIGEKNNFHAMLGFQAENLKELKYGMQREGILVPDLPEIDITTGVANDGSIIPPSVNGSRREWDTAGFFGRINYNYDNRYLIEGNLRYDGTSRFRQNRRWIWLPSVSLGWNIAQEKFWEDFVPYCNTLKLRGSYGMLGNQNVNDWYQTYRTLDIKTNAGSWLQNGAMPNIVGFPALISQLLTWEKIYNYNFGLDWGLFNNRLTGSFEYFIRDTKNMVGPAPELPAILGTNVPMTNNCDLRTRGWDLEIAWNDRLSNGLTYGARFVLSDARTKITKYTNNPTNTLPGENPSNPGRYIQDRYVGEIWGFETLGIAKTDDEYMAYLDALDQNYINSHDGVAPSDPRMGMNALGKNFAAGDIMYKDLNGDGVINSGANTLDNPGDKKLLGNSTPRFMFSLDLTGAYKGFDLRVFFQGVMKRDFFQNHNYFWGSDKEMWWMQGLTSHADYFRGEDSWSVKKGYAEANTNAYYPRPVVSGGGKNRQVQSRYLQDASYIRLKNLQVGYTLPTNITEKAGLAKVRVYFSGENLWTGTNLSKLFDPETINSGKGGSAYPLSRTYSFGLSLTL